MSQSSSPPPTSGRKLEGIEVVELSDVDIEFEQLFGKQAAPSAPLDLQNTRNRPATADDLRALALFHDVQANELDAIAGRCRSTQATSGHVLLSPGRINNYVYIVVDGELRAYDQSGTKRPTHIVEVGQSFGLRSALDARPVNHSLIATEISQVVAVDVGLIEECVTRSHTFARNYASLLTSYVRGDHCLTVGRRIDGRPSYVDDLTLLHNQYWLDTIYPRLVTRCRLSNTPLAVVGLTIDRLGDITARRVGAGVRVIAAFGQWILDQTRPTDLIAINRHHHFYAFLPGCDVAAARQLAARLQKNLLGLRIRLVENEPPATITLSLGVIQLETATRDRELLTLIDALIRKSVGLGGNCISDTL